jgi:hypothetical protein
MHHKKNGLIVQEWAQPTERYEEFVSTSRCFDALVRPRQPGGPDALVTVSFR